MLLAGDHLCILLGYEHMSATMLRRSASQPFQSQRPLPRSVGNTPPLPVKHNLTSHYMPLQAYEDYQQQHQQPQQPQHQQHHQMRLPPSNSVYNGSNIRPEFILTPRQAQQLQQRYFKNTLTGCLKRNCWSIYSRAALLHYCLYIYTRSICGI